MNKEDLLLQLIDLGYDLSTIDIDKLLTINEEHDIIKNNDTKTEDDINGKH